ELKEKIKKGDASSVLDIQLQLRELPLQIQAVSIAETRRDIDKTDSELTTLHLERNQVLALKGERQRALIPIIDEFQEAQNAVAKVDLALSAVDAKTENARERRRELHKKLQGFLAEVTDDKL